ncbi:MAG: PAS domain S-box protein [Desulfobacteraceae bacterium]|nr:PAS domain S-box protein [Desulfobacteraceae bacterium]
MAKKPTYEQLEQRVKELEKEAVERRRLEERMRLFSLSIEQSSEGIAIVDMDGNLKYLNDAFAKMHEYSLKELIGKNLSIFHTPQQMPSVEEANREIKETGEFKGEIWHVRRNGTVFPTLMHNSLIRDEAGTPIGVIGTLRDITEGKQAEEELRESEEEYRSLVDSTEDSIYLLGRNCTYLFMNKEHLSSLGVVKEKVIGRNYSEFHSEDDSKDFAEKVENVFKTGKSLGYEYQSQRDGRYFIRTLSPVRGSDKKTISVTVVSKDITERKRIEEKLDIQRAQIKSLFDYSSEAMVLFDLGNHIIDVNLAFEEVFGYSLKEAHGKVIEDLICPERFYHTESKELDEQALQGIKGAELIRMRKDGKEINVRVSAGPIKVNNIITGRFAIFDDITERKQAEEALRESEEKYRSMMEAMKDPVYICSPDFRVEYMNPAMIKRTGHFATGEHCFKALHDLDEKCPWCMRDKAQQGENIVLEIVSPKDNRSYYISQSPVVHGDGSISKMTVFKDTTDLKKLETQLLQAQKMETIGILAGGVAHDLNNILSGIISYPELLLMDLPEGSPLRKPLLTIKSSGEKAAVVVQDLLTLARRGVTITEIVNLNSIISEQLKSPEFENLKSFHPNVDIETNLEKDLLNIKGSTVHLSKTVMNLVSNAAEAMPDGGKVLVSTENLYIDRPIRGYDHVDEGDYVVVTVSDTGIGISKKDMNRIFEPFYTKKIMGRSGTGLGMAVVWGTVKDHNGYIDVESTEGKARPPRLSESDPPALQARALRAGGGQGTTFTLYFPVTREELAIDKSLLSIEDYMGKGESILIIDDVEEQRDIASGMLKKLGYSVTSVSSGEEAIEYMKDNSVDLLLLDMIMDPGIDGLDTYKRILKLHPKQKAIIASGFSETDRVKEAKRLGAGAYVKKPYVLEKIGVVIKEELEK